MNRRIYQLPVWFASVLPGLLRVVITRVIESDAPLGHISAWHDSPSWLDARCVEVCRARDSTERAAFWPARSS